jgi:hypothetical protein
MPNLRFEFRVLDDDDNCVAYDRVSIPSIDSIDRYGGCEAIDMHVGAALRAVKRDAERVALAQSGAF